MDGGVLPTSGKISAAPYRTALTEMGALIRADVRCRAIWDALHQRRAQGFCDFTRHCEVEGVAMICPSVAFAEALDQMRAVLAGGAVK